MTEPVWQALESLQLELQFSLLLLYTHNHMLRILLGAFLMQF
jgi:hypothetical protein